MCSKTVELLTGWFGAGKVVDKLTGKGDTPTVLRENPAADQARLEADAAAKTQQESIARRRRTRSSSLLATGGQGDAIDPVSGQPTAIAGKSTLGS